MKNYDNKVFEEYLTFLATNPDILFFAIMKYYSKFNVPKPSKDELKNIILYQIDINKFTDENQNKQIRQTIDNLLSDFFD